MIFKLVNKKIILHLLLLTLLLTGTGHGDDYFLLFENQYRQPLRPDEEIISNSFIKMLEEFAESDNGSLAYDDCVFPNNIAQEQVQFVLIKRHSCEILKLD